MEWVIGDGSWTSCTEKREYGLTYCAQTYACGFSKGQNLQPPTVTGLTPSRLEIPVGGKAAFSATASDADGTVESVIVRVAGGSDQTTPGESKKSVKVSYSRELSKPGRYYATVTATDNDGLKGSATVEIVVGTDAERAGAPSIAALSMSPESGDPPLKIGVSIVGFSLDTITDWTISWGDGGSDFTRPAGSTSRPTTPSTNREPTPWSLPWKTTRAGPTARRGRSPSTRPIPNSRKPRAPGCRAWCWNGPTPAARSSAGSCP